MWLRTYAVKYEKIADSLSILYFLHTTAYFFFFSLYADEW